MEDVFAVKLCGLPFDAKDDQVANFLSDCKIKNNGSSIYILVGPDNRAMGEAIVELNSQEDLSLALNHHHESLGHRYIEVMTIPKAQMENELSKQPGKNGDFIVRMRGLPFSASIRDIMTFLGDCNIQENCVNFTFTDDGRPSGEAFVDLCSEEDVSKAIGHNNEHMGRRYVEIFRATQGQKDWDCRVESENNGGGMPGGSVDGGDRGTGVVRLRGLPYGSTQEQVTKFFSGLSIVPDSIVIQMDDNGRETGEGFVEFASKEEAEKALDRDRGSMGHRYIELFRSTRSDVKPFKSLRPTPYDRPGPRGGRGAGFGGYGGYGGDRYQSGYERPFRGRRGGRGGHYQPPYGEYDSYGGEFYEDGNYGYNGRESFNQGYQYAGPPPPSREGGRGGRGRGMVSYPPIRSSHSERGGGHSNHIVRMRGLPFSAKEKDLMDFFSPQVPTRVHIEFDDYGRPSGEGEICFSSHGDAESAMSKNNQHMGHRYIELFLHSVEDQSPPSGPTQNYPPQQQQAAWSEPQGKPGPPQNQPGPPLVGVGYASQNTPPGGFQHHTKQQPPGQPQGQPQGQFQQATGFNQSSSGFQQQPQAGYQTTPQVQSSWGGVGY